ncbi:hypothetical protein M0412_03830 [Agrobacterium sp. O3.4]|uniref:Uncharacterized protein n=1 Tax=Agrobacterium cucumeris TaxID=2862866 RepID=A0ABY8RH84_9HYPH|nr:hypothetical protein [Agrobacterium cucumeris]MCZ7469812.1 hypothetical protein [Rhizobium rhizogenes]WHO06965.1 hypothetical protein KZ699_07505 [Agrobacterium cucumeris]
MTAYIEGVVQQDFDAIIAATAADKMSAEFDFVASVDRLKALAVPTPAPATSPLFVKINKSGFAARIASQVKFLIYGLMTTNPVVEGKSAQMEKVAADEFATTVSTDRLAGVKLVKVAIPSPALQNSEKYQLNAKNAAKVYGADASAERVALISFEGLHFAVGFHLFRYGDEWGVSDQTSSLAGLGGLGTPKRVTPETFADLVK